MIKNKLLKIINKNKNKNIYNCSLYLFIKNYLRFENSYYNNTIIFESNTCFINRNFIKNENFEFSLLHSLLYILNDCNVSDEHIKETLMEITDNNFTNDYIKYEVKTYGFYFKINLYGIMNVIYSSCILYLGTTEDLRLLLSLKDNNCMFLNIEIYISNNLNFNGIKNKDINFMNIDIFKFLLKNFNIDSISKIKFYLKKLLLILINEFPDSTEYIRNLFEYTIDYSMYDNIYNNELIKYFLNLLDNNNLLYIYKYMIDNKYNLVTLRKNIINSDKIKKMFFNNLSDKRIKLLIEGIDFKDKIKISNDYIKKDNN